MIAYGTDFPDPLKPPAPRTHWTATDLLAAEFPPPRWAVPGILAEGVNLLVGAPKVGKSWAALNIAVAVAAGGDALGSIAVDAGPVLYLALEDTGRRLQDRLRKVLGSEPTPHGLEFVTECPPIADGGLDRIGQWLTGHADARLVVVDVFARLRGHTDTHGNAYAEDYAAMRTLKDVADRHGVAMLVVHHTRKASAEDFLTEVSGTNGLAGSADAVLVLKRSRGQADAELHVTGRDVDEHAYALTFDAARGLWTMLDGPAGDYALSGTRRRVLAHVREHDHATPKQLADALGIEHATAKQTVRRMAEDGQLDSDGRGSYHLPPVQAVTPVAAVTLPDTSGDSGDRSDSTPGDSGRDIPLVPQLR